MVVDDDDCGAGEGERRNDGGNWERIHGVRLDGGDWDDIRGNVGISVLVPTGTSAFSDPAAFVTATPSFQMKKG